MGLRWKVPSVKWFTLALIALALATAWADPPTASTDMVPRENWTYDALTRLAAHGLIPDQPAERFTGNWLYSREEMAGFVADTIGEMSTSTSDSDRDLVSRLAAEFLPELKLIGAQDALATIELYPRTRTLIPAGFIQPELLWSDSKVEPTAVYNGTALALLGSYATAGVTFSNRRSKFEGSEFSNIEKYFIHSKTPNWEWEIGNDYLWWGPGYSGSMILSDNSPSFPFALVAKDFNFGHQIGHVKITQFASTFQDNGQRFYLIGRRWEKRFSPLFHLGVNETAKTSDSSALAALAFPAFYLYEHIFLTDVDTNFNELISVDFTYELQNRYQAYFDLLFDDMVAPSFLRNHANPWNLPRKLGVLVGNYWPNLDNGTTTFRVEYIQTDPGTYGATRDNFPEMAYTHDGLVIGHPVGGNSRAIFVRADREFRNNWVGVVEYLGRQPVDKTGINPENTHQLSLLLIRDLAPSTSLIARYDNIKNFDSDTENRFQLGASYAF